MVRTELLDILKAEMPHLTRKFGVVALSLFGSAARDELRPESDVDLLVEFNQPATFDSYFGLKTYLEDRLGRPVDLATDQMLKPRLRRNIAPELIHVT